MLSGNSSSEVTKCLHKRWIGLNFENKDFRNKVMKQDYDSTKAGLVVVRVVICFYSNIHYLTESGFGLCVHYESKEV